MITVHSHERQAFDHLLTRVSYSIPIDRLGCNDHRKDKLRRIWHGVCFLDGSYCLNLRPHPPLKILKRPFGPRSTHQSILRSILDDNAE